MIRDAELRIAIKHILNSNGLDEQFWTAGIASEIFKKLKELNVIYKSNESKWDKEFEFLAYIDPDSGGELCFDSICSILELYKLYLDIPENYYGTEKQKVKIKVKDGAILIERIDR